jgi:hypothetical protein
LPRSKKASKKAASEAKVNKQKEKFNDKIDQFSVTLNKKHFDEALEAKEQLKQEGQDV